MARWICRSRAIGAGTFEPQLVPKGMTRLEGFDDKIISLYARGLTVREIQRHLREIYGTDVSPDLISRLSDAVLEQVKEWQARPLDACYPIVFFDALRVKIRDEGLVRNKAVYAALALDAEGHKHVLGLWIEQTEGAKFWPPERARYRKAFSTSRRSVVGLRPRFGGAGRNGRTISTPHPSDRSGSASLASRVIRPRLARVHIPSLNHACRRRSTVYQTGS